ncbi:hypothetical protein BJF78_30165 [Pseudonocardia sp. CNS-139]|nr:hypothetical protein BJF78_30165 [Pseudonocardia sp. CNS-139]
MLAIARSSDAELTQQFIQQQLTKVSPVHPLAPDSLSANSSAAETLELFIRQLRAASDLLDLHIVRTWAQREQIMSNLIEVRTQIDRNIAKSFGIASSGVASAVPMPEVALSDIRRIAAALAAGGRLEGEDLARASQKLDPWTSTRQAQILLYVVSLLSFIVATAGFVRDLTDDGWTGDEPTPPPPPVVVVQPAAPPIGLIEQIVDDRLTKLMAVSGGDMNEQSTGPDLNGS